VVVLVENCHRRRRLHNLIVVVVAAEIDRQAVGDAALAGVEIDRSPVSRSTYDSYGPLPYRPLARAWIFCPSGEYGTLPSDGSTISEVRRSGRTLNDGSVQIWL
jgi:hypothetical protein